MTRKLIDVVALASKMPKVVLTKKPSQVKMNWQSTVDKEKLLEYINAGNEFMDSLREKMKEIK